MKGASPPFPVLGVLALVACLCATATAGTPVRPGQTARTTESTAATRGATTGPAPRCAAPKQSSFHASGGHRHRKHHPTNCVKRGRASGEAITPSGIGRAPVKPADAGACPGADLQPTQSNIEVVRTATLCLIDQERNSRGEASLQFNADLQQSAQAHTESMAFGDYFEHDGPGGDTPLSRMIAAGYISNSHVGYEIGENIGWGTFSLGTPRAIVAAWMASPGHRANILDAHFRDTAIGVSPHVPSSLSQGQPGGIYTQDFGVIITG